jgi:hypothetical protein
MANNPSPSSTTGRKMKWEEEKAQLQYDVEKKTLLRLVNIVITRNKDLYDINAERHRYHKG